MNNTRKKKILICTIILIIIILAFAVFYYFFPKKDVTVDSEFFNIELKQKEIVNENYTTNKNLIAEKNFLKNADFNFEKSLNLLYYQITLEQNKAIFTTTEATKQNKEYQDFTYEFIDETPIYLSSNAWCSGVYAIFILTDKGNIYSYETNSDDGIHKITKENIKLKTNVKEIGDNLKLINLYPYQGLGCSVTDTTFILKDDEIYDMDGNLAKFNKTFLDYRDNNSQKHILIDETSGIYNEKKENLKDNIIFTAYREIEELKEVIAIDYEGNIYYSDGENIRNSVEKTIKFEKIKATITYSYKDDSGMHFILNNNKELDLESYRSFYSIYDQIIQ